MPAKFQDIKQSCLRNQELTRRLIDEFLLYYAADRFNIDREVHKQFARYRHFIKDAPERWINMMKAQYIAHRIFKEDGLINRIINHRTLSHLEEEEVAFLRQNQRNPWRFSFSLIIDTPAKDFFEMEDVFTGDRFLLYSPGTSKGRQNREPLLWFNLINFNGKCWETYGVINPFHGFEPEDMLFYASQLHPHTWIEDFDEFTQLVETDPVPFMLLFLKSDLPLIVNDTDQFVQNTAEFLDDTFNSSALKPSFTIEYAHDVYRLSLKDWSSFPHFSIAYYDEKEQLLFLSATSDRGYNTLVDALNDCGYELPHNPDFRVNMGMLATVQEILRKDIRLNPYEAIFDDVAEDESGRMDNVNNMLSAIIPDINAGKKPDAEKLAQQYDVDVETARKIINEIWKKYGR
ncbi:hypothetical protein [Gracilimonas mengyeensis]|uniref:Uncharacterized protein n=1 Tax=Gracilimonas mengyeensis TaxID=1302730 RepID=A0A521CCR7_9BACT|nr:hypothetical protein [Gracilimonas mengyeensis]SMO57208.1 hypothetical protein SAMN06265219_10538 [Gracilimonas mengyeensis]